LRRRSSSEALAILVFAAESRLIYITPSLVLL
jgi:hypothetical protein